MKMSAQAFRESPRRAVTLIGMSGVGKTWLSCRLAEWGWYNYSCDYLIGTNYLTDELCGGEISEANIERLSDFVGQIGDPARGGVGLEEFRRRQDMYYEAECAVLRDLKDGLEQSGARDFICDSSGSLCEVRDEMLLDEVGKKTLMVYLKVAPGEHAKLLKRAVDYPKPLYFPPEFFEERLRFYMKDRGVTSVDGIDPDDFLSWVFPYLFESRLPKYQRLADQYGVTVSSAVLEDIHSAADFVELIAGSLEG